MSPAAEPSPAEEFMGRPVLGFVSAAAWRDWLAGEHASSAGLWLKVPKKDCPEPGVGYAEALDEALCYGWIDGQKRPLDEHHWLQGFSPRKARSRWSKINCGKAEALIAAGRMRPAGLLEVERAKADGRWDSAYEAQSTAEVPADLQAALDANPAAAEFFAQLNRTNRYAVLYRVQEPKRPATRAARIEKFVAMLEKHETIHPVAPARKAAATPEE
ncbi:MAG TPA: YdeI/OmpD-associated family protein [Actinocrinis sp.]|nr:YdeI/OmpD-associated family protein [Actinocrinis sp.]